MSTCDCATSKPVKRPSFQFYPGDWRANSNLQRCSLEEKRIWIEVMCLLHNSDEYGLLRWPLRDIAGAVGCGVRKLQALVDKAVLKGADQGEIVRPLTHITKEGELEEVVPEQSGPLWYSSRMVRDEHIRLKRGAVIRRFAKLYGVHIWLVAHPTKPPQRTQRQVSSSDALRHFRLCALS